MTKGVFLWPLIFEPVSVSVSKVCFCGQNLIAVKQILNLGQENARPNSTLLDIWVDIEFVLSCVSDWLLTAARRHVCCSVNIVLAGKDCKSCFL